MSEKLLARARNALPLNAREMGGLITATAVTLGLAGCGHTQKLDTANIIVSCPTTTKAKVEDEVQPEGSDPGSIAFKCVDSKGDLQQTEGVIVYNGTSMDADVLSNALDEKLTQFDFKLWPASSHGAHAPQFTVAAAEGSTLFGFVEISGITHIQTPPPSPEFSFSLPPLPSPASSSA